MRKLVLLALLLLATSACSQTTIGGSNFPLINSGPPPNGQVGVPYVFSITATGGTAPLTYSTNPTCPGAACWLPPGLSINGSTGVVSGTPTTAGLYSGQFQVTDAVGNFSAVNVAIQITSPLSITPGAFPNGQVGVAYTTSPMPTATGGVPPYSWAIVVGSLTGTGLSLNGTTGVISGSPTSTMLLNLTMQVSDSAKNTATQANTINIQNITISSSAPPNGFQSVAYGPFQFTASGGTTPYTWALASGSTPLPNGLSLSSAGVLSGTPTTLGTFTPTIQVTDSSSPNKLVATAQYTIVISAAPSPLTVTNNPPPNGTVGTAYTFTLTATGGTPPYTWTLNSGANPSGTSLTNSNNTGVVSGTPTTAQTVTPVYKVTDNVAATALAPTSGTYSITINSSLATCGPSTGYACSKSCTGSTGCTTINYPAAPFSGSTGQNTIAYDPSINGTGSGTTGVDPIVRATDQTTGGTSFTLNPSGGAGDNVWNSNDTMLMAIQANNGTSVVLGFNPSTMQITNPGALTNIPNSGNYSWSYTNSNLLYSFTAGGSTSNTPKVYKTTFTSPSVYTQTLYFDPTVSGTGGCLNSSGFIPTNVAYTGGSITGSSGDSYIQVNLLTAGQNSPGYSVRYNTATGNCSILYTGAASNNILLENGTVTSSTPYNCFPIGFHNSTIFKDGLYSRVSTSTIGSCTTSALYWQMNTSTLFTCGAGTGHNINGYQVETIANNPVFNFADVTQSSSTFCSNLSNQVLGSFPYKSVPGDAENHFGSNNWNTLDNNPFIGGTAFANWPGGTFTSLCTGSGVSCAGISEVYAVVRNPSYKWVRFVHSFTSGSVLCPACDFRTYENIVGSSQTGKFAAFESDMLLGLGTDSKSNPRQDVFIVRLD
jgi:hypothetical protein